MRLARVDCKEVWSDLRIPMTEQYLVGEFSSLLGELQPVPDARLASALRDLRRQVEACPPCRLSCLARQAITLTDVICWSTFQGGDVGRFCEEIETVVRLEEFAITANLLPARVLARPVLGTGPSGDGNESSVVE